MKKTSEVMRMTNKQSQALIEAIKIIVEKSKDLEEVKSALDRIQSTLSNPSK